MPGLNFDALFWFILTRRDMTAVTDRKLVDALSVEELPYDQIPKDLYAYVTAFRKLRQDQRINKAHQFLETLDRPKKRT